jgi:hypothetical protein
LPVQSSGLTCNLCSWLVTPELHYVYNSKFQISHAGDTPPPKWTDLVIHYYFLALFDK